VNEPIDGRVVDVDPGTGNEVAGNASDELDGVAGNAPMLPTPDVPMLPTPEFESEPIPELESEPIPELPALPTPRLPMVPIPDGDAAPVGEEEGELNAPINGDVVIGVYDGGAGGTAARGTPAITKLGGQAAGSMGMGVGAVGAVGRLWPGVVGAAPVV
jgi:hypothetical protein